MAGYHSTFMAYGGLLIAFYIIFILWRGAPRTTRIEHRGSYRCPDARATTHIALFMQRIASPRLIICYDLGEKHYSLMLRRPSIAPNLWFAARACHSVLWHSRTSSMQSYSIIFIAHGMLIAHGGGALHMDGISIAKLYDMMGEHGMFIADA